MSDTRNDNGFSLIELLLVMLILGILAAIVVVSLGGLRDDADESACAADRRTLLQATEAYFAQTAAPAIAPTGTEDVYEQTLVEAGLLSSTSEFYDLEPDGQLAPAAGSPCTV